ncbi:MAG TPA: DUF4918 family protein [Flavobacteriales bacterium]|nr:DUF4918 family protein [Flavobacteriales bacterium]
MLSDRLLRHVLSFSLKDVRLPEDIGVLDPFNGDHAEEVRRIVTTFHKKFFSDDRERVLMLGINPGRLGAGSTGLSFTDTKRCESDLGIPVNGLRTHEPSSDFFYRMIRAAGGAEVFQSKVYVHAVCPLGFVKAGPKGGDINLNYYDDIALEKAVTPFIEAWLRTLVGCGMRTDVVFCIGTGKNATFFTKLNERLKLFDRIVALEHPRFIMQYKAKQLDAYVSKYVSALHSLL